MNPLVLGLALATQGPAHPPAVVPVPVQYRQPAPPQQLLLAPPQFGMRPQYPPGYQPGYQAGYRPGYQPMPSYRPPFQAGYQPAPAFAPPPPHQGPMTLQQFAHCFQPTPGVHHAVLIHPCTGHPVKVCFTLPPGCPQVELSRHKIEFDYGRREVEIRFESNGTVRVQND